MDSKKRDDHFGDAVYEVWKRGGNPDLVDRDQSDRDFWDGHEPSVTSDREIKRQQKMARDRREREEQEDPGGYE